MMLLENDAPSRLLLLMTQAGVVEMVAVGMIVVAAAPVVVLLVRALLCIRGTAARPVTESYMAHRHKDSTAFRTGEESMSFVGSVAYSLPCC